MPTPVISLDSRRRKKGVSAPSRKVSGSVPCQRCLRPIPASSTTCPECGVHFQGWAEDFTESRHSFLRQSTVRYVLLATAVLLILLMLRALIWRF